ncbi:MmcQ/YjbR family DNA-binding protein [Sanguibacter antarcticus]|uniref:Putative DNA-binding protein (MmcQ/YjbR family) n=1 Tax=Sanguibacter antarcticus TaxID=372484 RepID=A0A2A9E8R9_9MICO|nr:MmcQ/YjbR family DNA-binding protein [Sanguibacter antarcticus]PFG34622.1 putative DNA-binding protein (MmcQ/YjbR family) [Sanguibacter antarcticus]
MDGPEIQAAAMATARELPDVAHEFPFGPEHDVFKVVGRVFLMATEATGEPIITLKCDPDDSHELRRELPSITPGYHVNKKHWISVAAGPGLTPDLVHELVVDSYLLVVEGLARARRPVLPDHLRRLT